MGTFSRHRMLCNGTQHTCSPAGHLKDLAGPCGCMNLIWTSFSIWRKFSAQMQRRFTISPTGQCHSIKFQELFQYSLPWRRLWDVCRVALLRNKPWKECLWWCWRDSKERSCKGKPAGSHHRPYSHTTRPLQLSPVHTYRMWLSFLWVRRMLLPIPRSNRHGLQIAQTVPGTRSHHCFIPTATKKLVLKRVSGDEDSMEVDVLKHPHLQQETESKTDPEHGQEPALNLTDCEVGKVSSLRVWWQVVSWPCARPFWGGNWRPGKIHASTRPQPSPSGGLPERMCVGRHCRASCVCWKFPLPLMAGSTTWTAKTKTTWQSSGWSNAGYWSH